MPPTVALIAFFIFSVSCGAPPLPRELKAGMQPWPLQFPPYSGAETVLLDVSAFLGGLRDSDTSLYSSAVSVVLRLGFETCRVTRTSSLWCRIALDRRQATREGGGANGANSHTLFRSFRDTGLSSVLELCQALVACPFWTQAELFFCDPDRFFCRPDLVDDLIPDIYALLRSSSSLSTLHIRFGNSYTKICYFRHLQTLLCENPFLETFILDHGGVQVHPETLAVCFSRNSVLKSFTLLASRVYEITYGVREWEVALRPFTTNSKSEANVALKELVIYAGAGFLRYEYHIHCIEALANLVRSNTTLENLELPYCEIVPNRSSFARALAVNQTLKEFGCAYSGKHSLKELLDVFIPDSSGHQGNTHITSLKLFPTILSQDRKDWTKGRRKCIQDVCRMLEFNSTLEHVEIGEVSRYCSRSWPPGLKQFTPNELDSMLSSMMRSNMSLQSLVVVGLCSLLRVGSEWQMKYHGPCLSKRLTAGECALLSTWHMSLGGASREY